MKRLLCGSVVLAASFGVVSCHGDPTSDFRNGPARIVAQPSSVFLDQGTNEAVVVRLEDDQGDPLATVFEITAPGTGITVAQNPDFQGTTVGVPLESEAQFIITAGDAPVPSSFTVAAGGLSLEIPVRVTPTSLAATFSNPAPAANEAVTMTAEGYTFLPDVAVSFAGTPAIILSVAEDGSSVTFLPLPGSSGPALVDGAQIGFLPGTPLSLETTEPIAVGALVPFTGTTDPTTAPALVVPPPGEFTAVFDAQDFAAAIDHFYRLDVTEAGDYTITLDWTTGSDIDLILCNDAACSIPDFTAATGNHPEAATYTLAVGTWYVLAEDFGGDAGVSQLTIQVAR
jgi:hypothetical protein